MVEELTLTVGELRFTGNGNMNVELSEGFQLVVGLSTLPRDLLANLKAVEPLLGGILRFELDIAPTPTLREAIEKGLEDPESRLGASAEFSVNTGTRLFRATAVVIVDEAGKRGVRWSMSE